MANLDYSQTINDVLSDLIDEIKYDNHQLRPTKQEVQDDLALDSMSNNPLTEDEEKMIDILQSLWS